MLANVSSHSLRALRAKTTTVHCSLLRILCAPRRQYDVNMTLANRRRSFRRLFEQCARTAKA